MISIDDKARRIKAMSTSERLAEERRQAQELADQISATIHAHGEATVAPMLNSVFYALLSIEARMLATLPAAQREMMITASARARPVYLAAALAENPARVVVVTPRTDA